jgi:hypothetical protein
VRAASISIVAIIAGRVAHEPVLKRLVALLVPLKVTDHFLFLDENTRMAIQTVEMFSSLLEKIKKKTKFQCNKINLCQSYTNDFMLVYDNKNKINKKSATNDFIYVKIKSRAHI